MIVGLGTPIKQRYLILLTVHLSTETTGLAAKDITYREAVSLAGKGSVEPGNDEKKRCAMFEECFESLSLKQDQQAQPIAKGSITGMTIDRHSA